MQERSPQSKAMSELKKISETQNFIFPHDDQLCGWIPSDNNVSLGNIRTYKQQKNQRTSTLPPLSERENIVIRPISVKREPRSLIIKPQLPEIPKRKVIHLPLQEIFIKQHPRKIYLHLQNQDVKLENKQNYQRKSVNIRKTNEPQKIHLNIILGKTQSHFLKSLVENLKINTASNLLKPLKKNNKENSFF